MAATTGYSAGIETNSTQISYAVETAYCGGSTSVPTAPATTFQAIRYNSETLSGTKSRQRPSEINLTREASQSVTVSEAAAGTISGSLSYGTFDDFFAATLNNTWQTVVAIAGITTDITITNLTATTATLQSTLSTKFAAINNGSWIRLVGFVNAANNALYRVTAKADNSHLTLVTFAATVTETSTGGTNFVRYGNIVNASAFNSLYIQQKLSSTLYLVYPGAYVTGFTVQGSIGQFIQSNFNVTATQEKTAVTDSSTGGIVAAPTGVVNNSVGNFQGIYWNDALIAHTADQFGLTCDNTGASAEYGLGSATAAGMLTGTFMANGTLRMFFKDFTYYTLFKNETVGRLSIVTKDGAGNAYVFTIPNATLMNPQISAGGPGQAVMATFSVEGNPTAAGGTLFIDRLPAV